MLELNYQKAKILIANKEKIMEAAVVYKEHLDSPLSSLQNPLSVILSDIESLASKSGGALLDMKPGQKVSKTLTHSIYTIDIGLQGNLTEVTKFIVDLHESNLLAQLDRAALAPRENLLQLKAKLSVVVF